MPDVLCFYTGGRDASAERQSGKPAISNSRRTCSRVADSRVNSNYFTSISLTAPNRLRRTSRLERVGEEIRVGPREPNESIRLLQTGGLDPSEILRACEEFHEQLVSTTTSSGARRRKHTSSTAWEMTVNRLCISATHTFNLILAGFCKSFLAAKACTASMTLSS